MKLCKLALFAVCLCLPVFAQTTSPVNTFSLAFAPLSLPSAKTTVVGTETGMTLTLTPNFDLREDNIVGAGLQMFGGGFNYRLPIISNRLQNGSPTLNGNRFQFYVTASAGVDRLTSLANTPQHYAFLAGGGINYDVTASGRWTFGAEVRYAKLPGFANNTALVAMGPSIHF